MAQINIYNGLNKEHSTLHANGKIKDVLSNLNLNNYSVIKAGQRLDSDYELTEEDVVFVRAIPHGSSAVAIAIVTTTVALGVAVGVGINANKKNQNLQKQLENAQKDINSIEKLPFLRGAKNQSALGKTIPFVMGKTYFAPYTLNNGFYSISGDNGEKQFWNVPLTSGYNNQKIKSVSIGNSKIKDFDLTSTSTQDGVYSINHSLFGNMEFEVSNNGELLIDGLNQKVIGQYYGAEVKHDFGKDAEAVIEQLDENAMRVEVCIRMDGLRKYNPDKSSDNYEELAIKVVPYWTNDNGTTWNQFYFDIKNTGLSYEWTTLNSTQIAQAVASGDLNKKTKRYWENGTVQSVDYYTSNSADYEIITPTMYSQFPQTIKKRTLISNDPNKIIRNTKSTCRFVASKTFTPAESFGKDIQIKVVKESVTAETNTVETVYLEYINTWCYDNTISSNESLIACVPLKEPFRDQTCRMGLKIEANDNTNNILDEINIITEGCARTWNGTSWSSNKTPTRNPAAWLLDILTSEYHNKSKYNDNEIDLSSFGELYEYCETNELYTDGIVTDGTKKSDLLSSILSACFSDIILDEEGKVSVVIDKPENSPIALLNEQNIVSIDYAKTFQRQITGLKTTYTNSNDWSIATEYFFKDGHTSYNQLTDTVSELALEYVTTHNHAYKVAQRKMRMTILQPRTITVNVGLEGDCYPLYKTVMLQTARFKQGLQSVTIHKVYYTDNGLIEGFDLSDNIEFVSGYKYGIIVQAQADTGRNFIYSEIAGNGFTNHVILANPVASQNVVQFGNIASVGLLNQDGSFTRVTNTMKIVGRNPASNHGWELVLKDYNSEIYETGTIPDYKPNMTRRPTTRLTLPTVKPVDVEDAKHSNWTQTKELFASLEEQISGIVTDTTVCDATVKNFVIDISDSGYTMTEQTFQTDISLKQSEIDLDFFLGTITDADGQTLDGFSFSFVNKKLTINVGAGVKIKAGIIKVPVLYKPIISYNNFVDIDGQEFIDTDETIFADVTYGSTSTQWNVYINYMGSGFGVYLGSFSNLSEIPNNTNVGDYFTWAGENRKQTSLVYDGYLLQAQVYKYIGNTEQWSWEVDSNSAHAQAALSDVLGIANADLENNNSKVWQYLDHLTSNSIYAGMIIANDAFIDKISARVISSDLVTTTDLATSLRAYEKIEDLNTTLGNYYTKTNIDDKNFDTVAARNSALNDYIKSTSIFGSDGKPLSTFATESINNAIVNGETVIKNGFINTNCLNADVVTTDYLETGDATFKGVISLINDSAAGIDSYIISSNYIADNEKGLKIYEDANKKGIVEAGVVKATTITSNKSEYGGYKALNFSCRTRFDAIVSFDTITSFFAENNSSQDTLYYGLGRISQDCEGRYVVGQGFVRYGTTSIEFSLMKVIPDYSINGYKIYIPYVTNNDGGILELTYTTGEDHIKHGSTNVTKLYFYGV